MAENYFAGGARISGYANTLRTWADGLTGFARVMQMRQAERDIYRWPKRFLKYVYSLIVYSLYGQPKTLKPPPDQEETILVIRTDGLGDLVLALPLLGHLRKSFAS